MLNRAGGNAGLSFWFTATGILIDCGVRLGNNTMNQPASLRARYLLVSALLVLMTALALAAQNTAIQLTLDARQAPMKILHSELLMPVRPGPLTLYYPKWIPGEHEPDGPIANVTGLKFTANGQTIPWRRDLLDVFTFHLDIPAGASQLAVSFDYIEPAFGQYTAGASATDKLLVVSWNQNLLYLSGIPAQQQTFQAKLILPAGWKFATALPVASQNGDEVTFQPVSLNRLVDSPVQAGQFLDKYDITPPGEPIHHELDIAADSAAAANLSPDLQQKMTNLVAELGALFGARHYRDYHFLFTLSDHVAHFGLEHHESDDSRLGERVLEEPDPGRPMGGLLAHEFVHSWNGKFRRPADLTPPYYEAPMQTDLLWVYEGLTDYLGNVLAARSGLWTQDQYHQYLANIAANLGPGRPGRTWRPLLDTAVAVPGIGYAPGWINWRRGTDYYPEGDLVWLEVDTIIHRVTNGQKTIADFLKSFYGGPNLGPQLKTYTFDQLVAALNAVAPYDWAHFFHERLDSTSAAAPLGGVESSGWQVVYTSEKPMAADGGSRAAVSAAYSIGLEVGRDGTVEDSIFGGPAYKAGISSGMRITGVEGRPFTPELLADAIRNSPTASGPIHLLVENDNYFRHAAIDYHGGARYPHLLRKEGTPDYLDNFVLKSAR